MSRTVYCVECGAKVVVYAKQAAMCDDCIDEIWTKIKNFKPAIPKPPPKEEKMYGSPDCDQSFCTKHLEKPDEFDRSCLKCSQKFKALGKFTRICDACKETNPYRDEPSTIY